MRYVLVALVTWKLRRVNTKLKLEKGQGVEEYIVANVAGSVWYAPAFHAVSSAL